MNTKFDVIIIGSGVIGMSIARELSQKGLRIAIIDRNVRGMYASYAAGGMLGAHNEFTESCSLFHLARQSQDMFQSLKDRLLSEVGLDIEYLESGLVKMAKNETDNPIVEQQFQFLHQHDSNTQLLSSKSLEAITDNNVQSQTLTAMLIPKDHQVNANQYTKALLLSLAKRHIQLIDHSEVQAITKQNNGYTVMTQKDTYRAEKVVVAAGAWSGQLLNQYFSQNPVTGVKGEVLLVEHPTLNLQTTLFMTNGCYIVPKKNHRYLIGATSYVDDYSIGVTKPGKHWLCKQAQHYVPNLANSKLIHQWSGIRPTSTNGQPIMGEVDHHLFVVTGHHRNGILLSPLIGLKMSEWIESGRRPTEFEDFSIERSCKT